VPEAAPRPRVCHVITGLFTGGAEMMLHKLLTAGGGDPERTVVVSLMGLGVIGPRLQEAGFQVHTLGMQRSLPSPRGFLALRRLLITFRPDVVQGWMYHGNMAALLATRVSGLRVPVAWNVRQTVYRLADNSPTTATLIRAGALLSRHAGAIIYNSRPSSEHHGALGYDMRRMHVIPNGFDLGRFRPDAAARESMRVELALAPDTKLLGMIARYDPMKDFPTMLQAMSRVVARVPDARLVLAGRDVTADNAELGAHIRNNNLEAHVRLLGEVADTPRLMSALDVLCSSSAWGEGFPNVLGEAMACGVPCVATDVGDSADIIGDTGIAVPPRDPAALGDAVMRLLAMPNDDRQALGAAARARVTQRYALADVAARYDELYEALREQQQQRVRARIPA
jgi:glycosyltransferase involved in cell wall biosynthesis